MTTDCAEAANAVIVMMSSCMFETMLDNVMQHCRLPKHEQQH